MIFDGHLYSVLIVSASEKFNTSLTAFFPEMKFDPVFFVSNIQAAKRELLERHYDLVFVNAPLPDEFGSRFAIDTAASRDTVPVMFVKSDLADDIQEKVRDSGVYVVQKPCSQTAIEMAVSWACVTRERLRLLGKKSATLEDKMGEIRLINHAKWLLIENLNMSEEDAHQYILKQSMNRGESKKEIAEEIISTYKNTDDQPFS